MCVNDDIELDGANNGHVSARTLGAISFVNLDDIDFEEFCFDLLVAVGFINVD